MSLAELSFEELLKQSETREQLDVGVILNGTVVQIDKDSVIIDAGLKSESPVPKTQFLDENKELEVEVGSSVEVYLDALEDGNGFTRLSREKAKRARTWKMLEDALESNETIKGHVLHKVKGGLAIEIGTVKGFLPGSLIDTKTVRDFSYLEDTVQDLKVIKMDYQRINVVVSRRAVIEEETSSEREALIASMKEGAVVKGVVKNLTDYGAFLDIGILDGLLHITDMAWHKVNHPSEIVEIGQEVDVKVLSFDNDTNRVSLGLKQLEEDTWDDLEDRYPINNEVVGKIANIADYGIFVEIEKGIEGLVHTSEINWTKRNVHPSKLYNSGEEVTVKMLAIDKERRRISLSIKQTLPNPWVQFMENHKRGEKISGHIKSVTDFGLFVGLEGDIDGLVHLNDFSWGGNKVDEELKQYKKGDAIDAVILSIDPERERISLGLKQLIADPFQDYTVIHPKNTLVDCVVREIHSNGVRVELADDVHGFIRINEISNEEKIERIESVLEVGQEVNAKIINIDRKNRNINLSIKAREAAEREQALKEYSGDIESNTPMGNLGALLKDSDS